MRRVFSITISIFLLGVFTSILCEDLVINHDNEFAQMINELEDVPSEKDDELEEVVTFKLKVAFVANSDLDNDDQTLFFYRFNLKTQILEVQIPPPELCA